MPRGTDWTGTEFANGWTVVKRLSCAEYRELNPGAQIKNSHYLCHNRCGADTYMEASTIKRAVERGADRLSYCKSCKNCRYKQMVRPKNLYKTIDRSQKTQVGDNNGLMTVTEVIPSGQSPDHSIHVIARCNFCNRVNRGTADAFRNRAIACDCYRSHSVGETIIKNYLESHNIPYEAEKTFPGLTGRGGGALRYDFALCEADRVIALIEFDGEQHFQETGFFNPLGLVQEHDEIKDKWAADLGIPLVRIPYTSITEIELILDRELDFYKNL